MLFNIYMNDLSVLLNNSNIGGNIGGILVNHLSYADDMCLIYLSSSQFDFPEYLGTRVDVNLACLGCRRFTAGAGVSLLMISNSVRQSSNFFCSWVTGLSNVVWGKPSSSTPTSSSCLSSVLRPVSYCPSGGRST